MIPADSRTTRWLLGALAAGLLGAPAVPADTAPAPLPLRIRADAITVHTHAGVAVYRGHVVVRQGGMAVSADWVRARVRDGQLIQLQARGRPVSLTREAQPGRAAVDASGARLTYDGVERIVTLAGQVEWRQSGTTLYSDRLRYHMNDGRIEADALSPTQPVRVIIEPRTRPPTGTAP